MFISHRYAITLPVLLFFIIGLSCSDAGKPLTADEVLEFGKKIESTIARKDASFMNGAIDMDEMFRRTTIPDRDKEAFMSELELVTNRMGTAIIELLTDKGSFRLIHQYKKGDTHHLVFRLFDRGRINYYDIEFIRAGGKCRIADMFIYLSGEMLSSTLYSLYMQMSESQPNIGIDWRKKVSEIQLLVNNDRMHEAKVLFDALPANIKSSRPLQVIHIQICSRISSEEFDSALREFNQQFPSQTNIQLLLVDGYLIRSEFDKAIGAIDDLDRSIGKDPILDFHRGIIYRMNSDGAKSRECLERLVKNMPDFEPGYLELIKGYLLIAEYEKARPLVDHFKTNREFNQADLNTLLYRYPGYISKFETN